MKLCSSPGFALLVNLLWVAVLCWTLHYGFANLPAPRHREYQRRAPRQRRHRDTREGNGDLAPTASPPPQPRAARRYDWEAAVLSLFIFVTAFAFVRVLYNVFLMLGITNMPVVDSTLLSVERSVGDWLTQGTENVVLGRIVATLIFSYFGYHVMAWASILPVLVCWFA